MKHLAKGQWPNLQDFRIGNLLEIQVETRSSWTDALPSQPVTGNYLSGSSLAGLQKKLMGLVL